MKAFIAYPFRVDSDTSYNLLQNKLKDIGYHLVVSNREDFSDAIDLNMYNIGKDLEDISKSNIVLFANNWENDSECRLLWNICKNYKIPMKTQKELFSDILNNKHIAV